MLQQQVPIANRLRNINKSAGIVPPADELGQLSRVWYRSLNFFAKRQREAATRSGNRNGNRSGKMQGEKEILKARISDCMVLSGPTENFGGFQR
jgi:hypothetical protein